MQHFGVAWPSKVGGGYPGGIFFERAHLISFNSVYLETLKMLLWGGGDGGRVGFNCDSTQGCM